MTWEGRLPGSGGGSVRLHSMRLPGLQRVEGPPGQGAADGFDAVAGGFVQVLCFVIEAGE